MLMPLIAPHIILILGSFIIGSPEPAFIVTCTHQIGDRTFFVFCPVLLKLGEFCQRRCGKVGFEKMRVGSHVRIRVKDFEAVSHSVKLLKSSCPS